MISGRTFLLYSLGEQNNRKVAWALVGPKIRRCSIAVKGDEPVDDADHDCTARQSHVHPRIVGTPVAVELSHAMSKLLHPFDGEELPPLHGETEHYIVRCYPTGIKRAVAEREQNILTLDEARAHSKECDKAMLDELIFREVPQETGDQHNRRPLGHKVEGGQR